jgi:ParB family chromosome partitioning protein
MWKDIYIEHLMLSPLRTKGRPLPSPTPAELVTVRRSGTVDPLTVRPIPNTTPAEYEILSGVKSWLAAQRAPLEKVPAYVRTDLTDTEAHELVRQAEETPLDPIRQALVIEAMVDDGMSIAAAGRQLKLRRTVAHHLLRLLRLPESVQALLAEGQLQVGHARPLVSLRDPSLQLRLAQQIVAQRLKVREVERLAREHLTGQSPPAAADLGTPSKQKDPVVVRLENAVGELLGQDVEIVYDERQAQGHLRIGFHGLDELGGVLERLGYQENSE